MTPETLSRGPLNPARILVIKLRHHGDMLLITPLIHALKQQYPAASVDVLLYEETRDMLAANPDIHHIYGLDRRWKKQGKRYQLKMQWQLIQTLRQQRYDMVLNLADQWPSAVISKLTGAATRIGFDFPKRRHPVWRYCHTALASTQQHNQLHTVQQNLSILAPLGLQLNEAPARMGYSEADWAASRALLPEDFREHYIVIQPTSRWFFKCWREDRMSALINALSAEGYAVPMHMAAALGTPLVALFGPSKLTFWRPWQAKGEVIWAGDFGPLPDPDAINTNTDERYLDLIPTDAVIAAAKKVLA
ncbi:TPA: putative lipopolysaccharide heptosyltransferase III [Klebsiella pneumoniae]|nr:putative lipopolysaccharide heptosyltransferase III [Klebsiella pneumoniae]